jgi:hypothetical protein
MCCPTCSRIWQRDKLLEMLWLTNCDACEREQQHQPAGSDAEGWQVMAAAAATGCATRPLPVIGKHKSRL